jgi:hypothetical protein
MICSQPSIALSGILSSWETVARNSSGAVAFTATSKQLVALDVFLMTSGMALNDWRGLRFVAGCPRWWSPLADGERRGNTIAEK